MKRALYIGIYTDGSTSKMRADILKQVLRDWDFTVIDTDIPKRTMSRLWQSIGFRYKCGPLIKKVNNYILQNIGIGKYDLIWIDKAIYITSATTKIIRQAAKTLVHYTPDPAFTFHRSRLFYASMPMYDYMITTKKFELEDFAHAMGSIDKVLYATQGFDKKLHRPLVAMDEKQGVAFIGHFEKERLETITRLLESDIDITLAGIGWDKFVKTNSSSHLHYLGQGVFGEDYVRAISNCRYAWGAVSKWIPEKHTTRTFEIPACKTALLTERNEEIESFFTDEEVIYYSGIDDLIKKIKYYEANPAKLKALIERGYARVQTGGFDYESIIRNLLIKVGIPL